MILFGVSTAWGARFPRCGFLVCSILACSITAVGCGGAPWFLGKPLNGHPSIPDRSRVVTVSEHRRNAEAAHAAGNQVLEIAELLSLQQRDSLRDGERDRLIELLTARVSDWATLGRPIPMVADLRNLLSLAPSRRLALTRRLRNAERAAGDHWLAIGQNERAEEEYREAERAGAEFMVFRFRAVWGAAVSDMEPVVLERAIRQLPLRVLGPFSSAYLDAAGADPETLYRAWKAARVFGPATVESRVATFPVAAGFMRRFRIEAANDERSLPLPGPPVASAAAAPPTDADLFSGPTLAARLVPAARRFPELLAPSARTRMWAERLLAEDPTAPDSLEVAAMIEARAGRTDSAARKLEDLFFYSVDRARGAARSARVWEQVGQGRRACASLENAARSGAFDDSRWCEFVTCAERTPGSSDPVVARRFVTERAPDLLCELPATTNANQ